MKEPPSLLSRHILSTKRTLNKIYGRDANIDANKTVGILTDFRRKLTLRNATFLAPIKGTRISVINGAQ